uniref:peptidoglycan bridge formation glycyltransferase FemA/FemB family protein n=1 Tax=Staphylococcus aureus TaxID=1280 RepID=UPI0011A96334
YHPFHEHPHPQLFLLNFHPKQNIPKLNQQFNQLHPEITKSHHNIQTSQNQAKKPQNIINHPQNKIPKNQHLKPHLEALQKQHPQRIYLSPPLLMFPPSKSYYLYPPSSNQFTHFLPNHH